MHAIFSVVVNQTLNARDFLCCYLVEPLMHAIFSVVVFLVVLVVVLRDER